MAIIIKYKEWLKGRDEGTADWVYDLCSEYPEWDAYKKEYIFKKRPKRLDPREAKEYIRNHGMVCVCNNEDGMIFE